MSGWITQRWGIWARILLLLGLWLAVAMRFTATVDVFNLSKITFLWCFAIVSALFCFIWSAERRTWIPRLRLLRPALLFLLAMVAATLFSLNWRVSVVGVYGRYDGLVPHLLYALIALVVVALYWERPLDLKDFARIAVCWVLINGCFILLQKLNLEGITWIQAGAKSVYPVGTLGNSDFAGGALGIALPLCIYSVICAKHPETRAFLIGVVGLDLLCLWFTQARGGFLASAVGAGFMVVAYRRYLPRWTKVAAGGCVGLVACLGLLVVFHPGMRETPKPLQKFKLLQTDTLQNRFEYWVAATRLFERHPVVGTGLSTFYEYYPAVRDAKDGANYGLEISDEPHNVILGYAADSGLIGLVSYLALFGMAAWYGLRRLRALEGQERHLLIAFLATLAAYMAQSFVSIDVPPLAMVAWVAVGAIACLADPAAVARREATTAVGARKGVPRRYQTKARAEAAAAQPASVFRRAAQVGMVVPAAALLVVGIRPVMADYLAHMAFEPLPSGQARTPSQAIALDFHAARLDPLEATYMSDAATWAQGAAGSTTDIAPGESAAWLTEAELDLRAALRIQPGAVPLLANIAQTYTNWSHLDPSRYSEADTWWQRLAVVDPTDVAVHERYAQMLAAWVAAGGAKSGARSQQIQQLQLITRLQPKESQNWVELAGAYHAAGNTKAQDQALQKALQLNPSDDSVKALLSAPEVSHAS